MSGKTDKPMRCSLDVRKIPIEAYKYPGAGRKWKAVARGMRAILVDLASYADPNGVLGKFSPKMETLEEHHNPSTLYSYMNKLRDVGLLKWDRENHYKRRRYTILLPGRSDPPSAPAGEPAQEHLRDTLKSPPRYEVTPPRFAGITSEIRGDDYTHLPQETEISEVLQAPPSITVLETVRPSVPPSVCSEAVRNTDKLREGMAHTFGKTRAGEKLNLAGFENIQALADAHGTDDVLAVWRRWLSHRDTGGMKLPLTIFVREFEAERKEMQEAEARAAERADIKRRADESDTIWQEWIAEVRRFTREEFLASCADIEDWQRKVDPWFEANPPRPVLWEGERGLVPVDLAKEYVNRDDMRKTAENYFEALELEKLRGIPF